LPVVVDEYLLFDLLADRASPDLRAEFDNGVVLTTGSWYYRLARAAKSQSHGVLSSLLRDLDADTQQRVRNHLDDLPAEIELVGWRVVVPVMVALRVRRNLNLLAAEALAVAVMASAEIVVGVDTPLIRAGAEDLHIPYRIA
jgi:hypothetical protein